MSLISSTQTIVTEVAGRLNEDASTAAFEDQTVTDINQCTRDVAISFPNAPFLFTSAVRTLSAGTAIYPAFSDFEKMYDVVNVPRNQKLVWLPTDQADMAAPSASPGVPSIYTIYPNGSIKFVPPPAAAEDITYKYMMAQGTVSALSSTPPIPTKYNELYCLYGEYRGLRRQQRYEEADNVEAKYLSMKTAMITDLLRQTSENTQIRGARDFAGVSDYGNPITNIYNNNNY